MRTKPASGGVGVGTIFLLALAMATVAWAADPTSIEGILKVERSDDGQSYFSVDIGREIEASSDAGGMRRGRVLQIAGLDEGMVAKADSLVGKKVVISGSPFGAFTVHHYTEVLWLATDIRQASD